ncbi:NUDIX domain-containing protein [bacterium]|nr:MAG: NUDIX hydrolase [candidate division KSB1 bacterium]MBC6946618.1 NUDIX hydrolase [candidate division KSB1 bacterium]MCE7943231.1 NUDIX hydrolase [Chlorobi bacterium CHB1]MCL4706143.1 NUDIX domain-containing protein [bacterium]MDL1876677.1 NUDIX hydrolase [Cytophagia bacterium CHB2]
MEFEYTYCPKCSGKLETRFVEGRERQVCSQCGFIFYRNPIPAAAVILRNDDGVLLVQRAIEPRAGDWCLPAGFMEWNEGPEQTAIREVKEETNLDIALRGIYGVYPGSDYPAYKIVLIVYWGEILGGELRPGDDAKDTKFFKLAELPENIAFRIHSNILNALKNEGEGR